MSSPSGDVRRYIISIGVQTYTADYFPQLKHASEDAKNVAACFQKLGFKHVLTELTNSPKKQAANRALHAWFASDDRSSADRVVLYLSGHGLEDQGVFYFHFSDAQKPTDFSGSMSGDDFASIIARSAIGEFVVILDACFSGSGVLNMAEVLARKHSLSRIQSSYGLISASRPQEKALDHAFAQALLDTLTNPPASFSTITPYLGVEDLCLHVMDRMTEAEVFHKPVPNVHNFCTVIPNPLFSVANALNIDADMRYFTGRKNALKRIEEWLTARSVKQQVCVVTGSAGSGKSTLLAKIAASTHLPTFDLIKNVRNQTLPDLNSKLDEAFQARQEKAVRLLIDSLDEALQTADIIRDFLRRLDANPNARALIGMRRESPTGQSPAVTSFGDIFEIDLDTQSDTEMASYAFSRLMAEHEPEVSTPYHDHPDDARDIAAYVAQKAEGLFLLTNLWIDNLRTDLQPIRTSNKNWRQLIKLDPDQAFKSRLEKFGKNKTVIADLLIPLAFAEGLGLPWYRLWAAAASAISHKPYQETAIEKVRKDVFAFIAQAEESAVPVLRLYHEKLAEMLRRSLDTQDIQERLFGVMLNSVPLDPATQVPRWSLAPPHVRTHLVSYADKAGKLDSVFEKGAFLAAAEPSRVLMLAPKATSPAARRLIDIYLRAPLIDSEPEVRPALLQLAALRSGDAEASRLFESSDLVPSWRPIWVHTDTSESPHRLLAVPGGEVLGFAIWPSTPYRFAILRIQDDKGLLEIHRSDGNLVAAQQLSARPSAVTQFTFNGQPALAVLETEEQQQDSTLRPDWKLSLSIWSAEMSLDRLARFDLKTKISSWEPPTIAHARSFHPDTIYLLVRISHRFLVLYANLTTREDKLLCEIESGASVAVFAEVEKTICLLLAFNDEIEPFDLNKGKWKWSRGSKKTVLPDEIEFRATAISVPSGGNKLLLLGTYSGSIHVLKGPPWRPQFHLDGKGGKIRQLEFVDNQRFDEIISLDDSGNIKVWSVNPNPSPNAPKQDHLFLLKKAGERVFLCESAPVSGETLWLLNEGGLKYEGPDTQFLAKVFLEMHGHHDPVVFHPEGVYRLVEALDMVGGGITASTRIVTLQGSALPPSVPCRSVSGLSISIVDGRPTVIERTPDSLRLFQCDHRWLLKEIYSGEASTIPWFLSTYFQSAGAASDSSWIPQLIRMSEMPISSPEEIAAQRLCISTKDSSLLLAGVAGTNIVIARAILNVDRWFTIATIETSEPIENLAFVGEDKIAVLNETGCVLFSLHSPHQN